MPISLFSSPLRKGLRRVIDAVSDTLVIASPYIRTEEAKWLLAELGSKRTSLSRMDVLTDVRAESVLNGSLELDALSMFTESVRSARIVNLPRLHAKTYIADDTFALVTSANLTPSGLDFNFEYGVGVAQPELVRNIRLDIEKYRDIGNILTRETLDELKVVTRGVQKAILPARQSHERKVSAQFRKILQSAETAFLRAQIGQRTAQALFSDAILFILVSGPLRTVELHPRIQQMYTELCNDSEVLVINGQEFGKKWKHAVRNAQQALKRAGRIGFDGKAWKLFTP